MAEHEEVSLAQALRDREVYRCLKCGEEILASPYIQEPKWRRCPNVVNGQRCTAKNLYDPKEEKAVDMVDTAAKEPPALVTGAPEPQYGPPWKQYREQCREDTRTLGRGEAKQRWVERGMPPGTFVHLVPKKLKTKADLPVQDLPAPAPEADLQDNPVYLKGKVDAYEYIWRALASGSRPPAGRPPGGGA
ncbi:MAG: hypothetical protein Q8P22_10765 [Chloroflexota bacterium]|nr:hypothetical protein [Chloroflexota bacterium]